MHMMAAALIASLLHSPVSTTTINGVQLPTDALKDFSKVIVDVIEKAPPQQTITDLMPVLETVSDFYFPGSGIAEAIVFYAIANARPPNAVEQQRMWDRAVGVH